MTVNRSSFEERLFWVNEIIEKNKAINFISKKSGVSKDTLSEWVRKYRTYGPDSLHPYKKRNFYTEETKLAAVEEVLYKGASKRSVVTKYKLSTKAVLLAWISKYNKRKELKETGRGLSLMKSKKVSKRTSLAERIEWFGSVKNFV